MPTMKLHEALDHPRTEVAADDPEGGDEVVGPGGAIPAGGDAELKPIMNLQVPTEGSVVTT